LAKIGFKYAKTYNKAGEVYIYTLAEFRRYEKKKKSDTENLDLVVKTDIEELIRVAKTLGGKIHGEKDKWIEVEGLDLYNRLMIYAVVRRILFDPNRIVELQRIVKDLSGYEAHYWGSTFRKIFWETNQRRTLLRPAKAFKLVYDLSKR
jgi:hypothetical protein